MVVNAHRNGFASFGHLSGFWPNVVVGAFYLHNILIPMIGLDARMWLHPGIGRYIQELTRGFTRQPSVPPMRIWIPKEASADSVPSASGFEFKRVTWPIYSLTEQLQMPRAAVNLKLLHIPHFNIPLGYRGKLVVTVHDLTYLKRPETAKRQAARYYAQYMLKAVVRKADAILAVSESTKKDLLTTFPELDAQRVYVTHEAPSEGFRPVTQPQQLQSLRTKFNLHKPFVFFVGTLKPHKNVPTLVEAIHKLRNAGRTDAELVLAGKITDQSRGLVEEWGRLGFVRTLGEVSDQELASLYTQCECFVLPSFLEGFGLPVVEAMACGAPVVISNASSLPEVAGRAGQVFNPDKVDELCEVLYNILSNKDLRQNLIKASLDRAREFSWQKTAAETCDIYRKVLA